MPYKDRATYLKKQREFAARRKARKESAKDMGLKPLTPLTPKTPKISSTPYQGLTSVASAKQVHARGISAVNPSDPVNPNLRSEPDCINCGDTGLLGGSIPCPKCDAGLRAAGIPK